jgi:drug/metabolite transporter (DMT)-like permease
VRLRVGAALATVYVVWGSTYLAIMVAIETLPPLTMLAVRFLIAGALLYAWAHLRGDIARPSADEWRAAAVSGGLLLLGGTGAVAWSEQHLDSGVVALIVAIMPLWLALLDRAERITAPIAVGLAIGFAGVALLVAPGGGNFEPVGLVVVAGSLAWALGSLFSRGAGHSTPLVGTAMQMLAGGALLLVAGGVTGELGRLERVSFDSAAALLYLVVIGSLVGFTAYTWLLRHARTSLVGTYAFVNPVVAVLLGWAFLGEALTLRTFVAGTVIVLGVALIVVAPGRRRARAKLPAAVPARAR